MKQSSNGSTRSGPKDVSGTVLHVSYAGMNPANFDCAPTIRLQDGRIVDKILVRRPSNESDAKI